MKDNKRRSIRLVAMLLLGFMLLNAGGSYAKLDSEYTFQDMHDLVDKYSDIKPSPPTPRFTIRFTDKQGNPVKPLMDANRHGMEVHQLPSIGRMEV